MSGVYRQSSRYLHISRHKNGALNPDISTIYSNFTCNKIKLSQLFIEKTLQSLDIATRRYIRRWLRLPRDNSLGVFYASTDAGGLAIPVLDLTITMIRCQRMVKISKGDDPLVVCLGIRNNLSWSVPPSIDGIPLRSCTAEIRTSLNKQLVQSVDGRVLNMIISLIVGLDVIV